MQITKGVKSVLNKLPTAVVISDSRTRVRYANKLAKELLQLPRSHYEGEMLYDRIHPEDQPRVKQYLQQLRTEKRLITKCRYRLNNDTYILLERNTALLQHGNQLSLCRDVTAEDEAYRRLERFVSIAGHELRNPLSSIQLDVDLLKDVFPEPEDADQVEPLFQNINEQIQSQERMISDFLDVSKITKGKLVFKMKPVDVKQVVLDAVDHLRTLTKREFILTKSDLAKYVVKGDKDRLYQVFFNLLQNAAKYSPESTVIEIALSIDNDTCNVAIKDYGIGIKKADKERIFQDYFQSQKKPSEGLGIGLFLVSEIVKGHHGNLAVASKLREGSTFVVMLPLLGKG